MSGGNWNLLKTKHSGWQYDSINAPPLQIADAGQVRAAITKMQISIGDYDSAIPKTYDDDLNFRAHADGWNDRIRNTQSILKIMSPKDYNLIYTVLGTPVGIICLTDATPTYVSWIVTRPGTDNAGGILIEAAADYSQANGDGGRLELNSYDKKSTRAYKALGFVKTDRNYDGGGEMTLDPAISPLWSLRSDGWKLVKYADKKYRTARSKPLLPPPDNRN